MTRGPSRAQAKPIKRGADTLATAAGCIWPQPLLRALLCMDVVRALSPLCVSLAAGGVYWLVLGVLLSISPHTRNHGFGACHLFWSTGGATRASCFGVTALGVLVQSPLFMLVSGVILVVGTAG